MHYVILHFDIVLILLPFHGETFVFVTVASNTQIAEEIGVPITH